MLSNCIICLTENCMSGIPCKICKKSTCISCEQKFKKCPFCRTELPNWFNRLTNDTIEIRLNNAIQNSQMESLRFNKNKFIFKQIINNSDHDDDCLNKVLSGQLDTEDYIDLLTITKNYLYNCIINLYLSIDIDNLLDFFEPFINTIQTFIPENILFSGIAIFPEEIDEWINTAINKIFKKHQKNMNDNRKIEFKYRTKYNSKKHFSKQYKNTKYFKKF